MGIWTGSFKGDSLLFIPALSFSDLKFVFAPAICRPYTLYNTIKAYTVLTAFQSICCPPVSVGGQKGKGVKGWMVGVSLDPLNSRKALGVREVLT